MCLTVHVVSVHRAHDDTVGSHQVRWARLCGMKKGKSAKEDGRTGRWSGISAAVCSAGILAGMAFSTYSKAINQFRFFIYPDSYYYLMIAQDLLHDHRLTGTLGAGGMPFPPPGYAAMKVTFPLLVAMTMAFGLGAEAAGHAVAAACAVLAVPAAFWAVRRLLGSDWAALTAGALVATSYGLTYWAGFVMSDPVSVLLGFVVLGMFAKQRPDDVSNPGDIGTGLLIGFWLLSRPTYFVALPMLCWLGFSAFGWTWKRLATASAAALLPAMVAATLWFPPLSWTRGVLFRLLPVIGTAALVSAVAALLLRRRGTSLAKYRLPQWVRMGGYAALALAVPAMFLFQRAFIISGHASPFLGLDHFATRDVATVVLLVPGALVLRERGRGEIGGALLTAIVVMLGVYYWVEPRESRYLIHLLPFMVPVAASTVLLVDPREREALPKGAKRKKPRPSRLRELASYAAILATAAAVLFTGMRDVSRATASFLETDYPREVSAKIAPVVRPGETLVSALPWPYYFRIGVPTWAAGAAYSSSFTSYVASSTPCLVLCDASMRFHEPSLQKGLDAAMQGTEVVRFKVPSEYLYGYSGVRYEEPVCAYRMSAAQLRAIAASASAEASAASAAVPVSR